MPTAPAWIDKETYQTTWTAPLTASELRECFMGIADAMSQSEMPINVLFDLTDADNIPFQAPYSAIKSGFMWHQNANKVAVISTNSHARMLANIVDRITTRDIVFFPTREEALAYLKAEATTEESIFPDLHTS